MSSDVLMSPMHTATLMLLLYLSLLLCVMIKPISTYPSSSLPMPGRLVPSQEPCYFPHPATSAPVSAIHPRSHNSLLRQRTQSSPRKEDECPHGSIYQSLDWQWHISRSLFQRLRARSQAGHAHTILSRFLEPAASLYAIESCQSNMSQTGGSKELIRVIHGDITLTLIFSGVAVKCRPRMIPTTPCLLAV